MKRAVKTILAIVLGVTFLASGLTMAYGEEPKKKEERVKVDLGRTGEVKKVTVTNMLYPTDGIIKDYGYYDVIQNLSSRDRLKYKDGVVSGKTEKEEFCYSGRVVDPVIPWNISIRYFIDGKEMGPEEIAGQSGKFKMILDVTKNDKCRGDFFDTFLYSIQFNLDKDIFRNATAEGVELLNGGGDYNVNKTVMPGKETHIVVEADVRKLEMKSIEIVASRASEDSAVDDSEIRSSMDEIQNIKGDVGSDDYEHISVNRNDLDGKSDKFSSSTDDLDEKTNEFNDGTAELSDGIRKLMDGAESLEAGMTEMNDGSYELADRSQEMTDAIGILLSIDPLNPLYPKLQELYAFSQQVTNGYLVFAANIAKLLEGTISVYEGASELNEGIDKLNDGTEKLNGSIDDMKDASDDMKKATDNMNKTLDDMEKDVNERLDNASKKADDTKKRIDDAYNNMDKQIDKLTHPGGKGEPQSFASENNTDISRVDFIISTEAINYVVPINKINSNEKKSGFKKVFSILFGE